MAFRTILIEKALSIRLDLNNLLINYENNKYWIDIDEIATLIVEDPRCTVSLTLLSYLCEKGVNVLFTDSSHMPIGTLQTLVSNSRASKRINNQIGWQKEVTEYLWTSIVESKINNQINTLNKTNNKNKVKMIESLRDSLELGDYQNREGTVSRIYFKELYGNEFKRFNEDLTNYTLNYIYQIIRSKISQEIVASGYIPSIGIHHKSELNQFNLADDLIEPLRPICDYYVYQILEKYKEDYLLPEIKHQLIDILNKRIKYNNQTYKIHTLIQFYVQNMLSFLDIGDIGKLIFPELDEK